MAGTMYPPESIYNLIPREEVTFEKPPRYVNWRYIFQYHVS